MLKPSALRGVTLVEMMIGLAIVSLMLLGAVPAFTTMLQNQRLRATAESISGGLQVARAEAVKRNGRVEFVLTDDDPVAAAVSSITPSLTGRNWVVRYYNPATLFYEMVNGRYAQTDTPVVVTGDANTITFGGFGTTTLAAASTVRITNPRGGSCAPTGPIRCLNVVVSPGGQVRLCDPDTTLSARDTRKC